MDVPIELEVLGSLRVVVADDLVPINGDRKHRLIARLALTPGRDVTADGLINALWGDNAPRTAKQSVHVHISHIRDKLRPFGAEHLITTTAAGTYRLGIDRDCIDVSRFESLIDVGLLAFRSGNARHARDVLRDALELWDEPYPSLADHPGAIAERHRLSALHESAVDALCDALIELDEHAAAVPTLRQVLTDDPLRERPYAQLVAVYLSMGELGAAQAVLDHAERVFDEALGIAPSDELRSMLRGIEDRRSGRLVDEHALTLRSQPGRDDPIDVAKSLLLCTEPGADLRRVEADIVALAGAQERRVAWGRISNGDQAAPWSPLAELADLEFELQRPTAAESARALHRRLTNALVNRFSAGFVLVVEGIEHAGPPLLDYLALELTKPGPSPFTLIGITRSGDVPARLRDLGDALDDVISMNLAAGAGQQPVDAVFDDDEYAVLSAMVCATLPTMPDLIARAGCRGVSASAVAIDRLITRGIIAVEPGSKLSLRAADQIDQRLGLDPDVRRRLHLELAELVATSEADEGYRVVAEARHRLQALPDGSLPDAARTALRAAKHLQSIGAGQTLVELMSHSAVPIDGWVNSATVVETRLILGWAQMRAGRTDEGQATLEAVIEAARDLDRADLFAEAVRGLAEERSPQSSTDQVRQLVAEALDQLGDVVSDTRVQLMTDYANSFYLTNPDKAELLAADALEVGRSAGPATLARALTGYVQAKLRPGNAAERLELAIEAQQYARRSNSIESLVLALTYEASALIEMGELRRAAPPLRYAEALAFDSRAPRYQWWVAAWRALLDFAGGELNTAEDRFRAAFELWPTSARNDAFECFAAQLCALRLVQGRGGELLSVMTPMFDGDDLAYLAPGAFVQAQAGELESASITLDRLLSPCGVLQCHDTRRPYLLAMTAEAAHLAGAHRWGPALAQAIEPLADVHTTLNVWGGGGFYWGSLRHAHGLALHLCGDTAAATQMLVQAVVDQTEAGAPIFAARSQAIADDLATR